MKIIGPNFLSQKAGFQNREAQIFLGQEHSLEKKSHARAKKEIGDEWRAHLSELDPELEGTGGPLAMTKGKMPILTPRPKCERLGEVNGKGRVQLYAFQISKDKTVLIYNVYGWTSAAKNKGQAQRTDDILDMIFSDVQQQPKGPVFIAGDLNGDVGSFPA